VQNRVVPHTGTQITSFGAAWMAIPTGHDRRHNAASLRGCR
jgi:hypothetical protein